MNIFPLILECLHDTFYLTYDLYNISENRLSISNILITIRLEKCIYTLWSVMLVWIHRYVTCHLCTRYNWLSWSILINLSSLVRKMRCERHYFVMIEKK